MLPKATHPRGLPVIFLLLALAFSAAGADTNRFLLHAEIDFFHAQKKFLANTIDAAAAQEFARASFVYATLATNETQRAEAAKAGIAACRQLIARDPKSAPGHYYLGANLGELAQAVAPSMAAYKLVHEVEHEFKLAAELDVRFDYAGPARTLGSLYFQAPSWPLSVGSKSKAREWLERAAELAPEYPENLLNLAEAQLKWRQKAEAAKTLRMLAALWPAAKNNFAGEARENDWLDWTARRAAVEAEFKNLFQTAP